MELLRRVISKRAFPRALALTSLVALVGACTDFEVADAESPDAGIRFEEIDANEPAEPTEPDNPEVSQRVESLMSAVGLPIPDLDAAGLTDIAPIVANCVIKSVEVDLNIRHPWRGDLSITLKSPVGTSVVLKSYGDADQLDNVIGTYPLTLIPAQSLASLTDEEGMGSWTIVVADLDAEDVGDFESWGLRLFCQ